MQGGRIISILTPGRRIGARPSPWSTLLIHLQHRSWTIGRFPTPPWLHPIRKYSGAPGPSSKSSKTTSPTKYVPDVLRQFYEACVRDGFQGTFEEFSRQRKFLAYERAVKIGKFQGTYDAWRCEVAPNRIPRTCAYISSLRLTPPAEQFVSIAVAENHPKIRCRVLVNGQAVGKAVLYLDHKYKPTPGTLLRMYYDSEKHLLRFQTQDGEPLPEYTDIDLISKAASRGYRPLLILAHSEGLIPTVPDEYLPSFDLQTNTKSGYWVRANRLGSNRSSPFYHSTISFPSALGITRLQFRLSEPENFDYLRFFPYIHGDQTFRLWDVERGVDAPLKVKKDVGPWEPQYVKRKYPALFEHAKRLGYWKEF